MAIVDLYNSTGTSIGTNEYSLPSKTTSTGRSPITTDGVYQPFLDLSAVLTSDEYRFRVYEKGTTGTDQVIVYESCLCGKQSPPMVVFPSLVLMNGWDMTLTLIAGSARTIPYSIRQVA